MIVNLYGFKFNILLLFFFFFFLLKFHNERHVARWWGHLLPIVWMDCNGIRWSSLEREWNVQSLVHSGTDTITIEYDYPNSSNKFNVRFAPNRYGQDQNWTSFNGLASASIITVPYSLHFVYIGRLCPTKRIISIMSTHEVWS